MDYTIFLLKIMYFRLSSRDTIKLLWSVKQETKSTIRTARLDFEELQQKSKNALRHAYFEI